MKKLMLLLVAIVMAMACVFAGSAWFALDAQATEGTEELVYFYEDGLSFVECGAEFVLHNESPGLRCIPEVIEDGLCSFSCVEEVVIVVDTADTGS